MNRSTLLPVLLLLGSVAACGSPAPSPVAPAARADSAAPAPTATGESPTAAELVADIEAWEKTVQIGEAAPGHGLGGTEMLVDGVPVWPPQGPACAELVACCEGFAGDDMANAMRLACQFSVAQAPDCPNAIETIETIVSELGETLPASCPAGAWQ